ncbi:hypothetical protein ZWY2020_027285 [Hordeum vulgare]|nr:hypothetical protein ZWY2020_027285 [Hordeum vulgare]
MKLQTTDIWPKTMIVVGWNLLKSSGLEIWYVEMFGVLYVGWDLRQMQQKEGSGSVETSQEGGGCFGSFINLELYWGLVADAGGRWLLSDEPESGAIGLMGLSGRH